VIRFVGVAYLLYLGIHFLVSSYRGGPADAGDAPERSFRQGLLTNVTNPKVGLFYTSFMPQFIDPQGAVVSSCVLLSGIHIALSVTSLTAYGFLTVQARRFFKGPRFRRALDGIAGVALIGLGVRLLLE
jgi:threonine/homoserine/homoserine lactone efflux protein